jgi:hypothetical protein
MDARDETLLFSAIAILLAALTLGSLTELASTDSAAQQRELLAFRPVANRGESQLSRSGTCVSTAAAGAAQTAADEQG